MGSFIPASVWPSRAGRQASLRATLTEERASEQNKTMTMVSVRPGLMQEDTVRRTCRIWTHKNNGGKDGLGRDPEYTRKCPQN